MENKIHDKKIVRRKEYEEKNHYSEYKEILVEDFHGMCGYCGKKREHLLDEYQIDHFAPKSKFESLENMYTNLVLSCPNCNRLKSNKWIGDDSNIPNDGEKGFVDPANDEYDEHLGRDENGNIIWKTNIGKYMYDVFKFEIRPTRLFFKLDKLIKLKEILSKDESPEGTKKFKEIQLYIDTLQKLLKYKKKE